jgi:hypothetical protein
MLSADIAAAPENPEVSVRIARIERRYRRFLITTIVFIHVALCMYGAWVHSPTVDEPAYLASGLSHWHFGRFDLCKVSPPLVRLVAAVPVMLVQPKYEWKSYRVGPGIRAEHTVGHDFLVANGERSFWLFTIGRWGCIPFSLIGAYVCFRWALEFFGVASAYTALLLWCFSPNILAHAQLLTPDIGVTSLCIAACYTFWRWSMTPTWGRTVVWGAVLGLALLAKTNAVVLFAAFPIVCLVRRFRSRCADDLRTSLQVVTGFLVAVYMLQLGYGFEGTFQPLGKYKFFSTTFAGVHGSNRFEYSRVHSVPVPFPSAFLEGIDLQRRDFENTSGSMKTYLRGRWYDHGFWWYYLYVILVKVPVGTLLLCAFAALSLRKLQRRNEFLLHVVLPGILLLGLPCTQTGFGHSLRYILPAAPFAFLAASANFAATTRTLKKALLGLLAVSSVASSLLVFPHCLSYFNEPAGGPNTGHFHLLDGNMDWGQDLLFIKRWIMRNPGVQPVYVEYWGFLPLKELASNLEAPPGDSAQFPGTYLVSVNFLQAEFRLRRRGSDAYNDYPQKGFVTPAIRIIEIPGKN